MSQSLPESWRQRYFYKWEEYSRIRKSEYIELLDVAKDVHVETHRTNETDDEVECGAHTHWVEWRQEHVRSGERDGEPGTWGGNIVLTELSC